MSGALAVAMNAHGALEVFARGIDGVLCHKWQTVPGAGPWSDWESLGAPSNLKMSNLLTAATTSLRGFRDMHAFVVATDNALWHIWYKDQQDPIWSQWESFGGVIQNVLGLQLNQDGRLEVFSKGTDGALRHIFQKEQGGHDWSDWGSLSAPPPGFTAPMHVARNSNGTLEVFARGGDGALWHIYQTEPGDPRQPDGGPWSGWASLGGSITEALVTIYDAAGRQHVFAQWTDGSVQHIYQTVPSGGPWSNEVSGAWDPLGGVITGLLVVDYNQDGRLDLFARGTDNGLLHNYQDDPNSGPWVGSGWLPLGGEIRGVLKTFPNGDGRMEVFADRSDGALWHIWQGRPNDESSWSDWDSLGVIPFVNYGKTLTLQPSATVVLTSLADLVAMVRGAENSNLRIHAFGSGWSFSDCALTNDVLVDTSQLNSTIPRAQAIQQALKSSYNRDPNLLYHVQGGITIRDLYQRLDNFIDPGTGQARPLALETMPDSAGQTLAGAVSTGSHGADKQFGFFQFTPPLADSVLAIHLVGTSGTQHWIEPSQGITDPDKLRQFVAPDANIIYDDKTFNAVLVSLGCMGVVYALVLRVRDQYNLIETTIETTWKGFQARFFTWINDPANHYLKAVVVPYVDSTGDSPCLVIIRAIAAPQSGKPDRLNPGDSLKVGDSITSQNGLFTLILQGDGNLVLYWSGGPAIWGAGTQGQSVAQAIMQGDGNFVMSGPNGEYVWDTATDGHPGAWLIVQNDGNVVIYDQGGNYLWDTGTNNTSCQGGDPTQAVKDMVAEMVGVFPFIHGLRVKGILETPGDQYGRLVEAINFILEQAAELRPVLVKHYPNILRALWPAGTCGGKSYQVADLVNRGPRNASSGGAYSIEVAVRAYDDQDNRTFVPFVNDLLMAVAAANNTFLAGWLALRFTGGTRASLGMQQWPLTCHVEVSTVPGVDGLKELLGTILGLGYKDRGLPHMGQMLDITTEPGGGIFPRFQEWRDVYQQISNGKRTFANALSDRWELTKTTSPLGTMSVEVQLTSRVGTRRTIQVIVTDAATGNAMQGAKVAVLDNGGNEQSTGTTDGQGVVSLTYTRCFDSETHTPMTCEGTVRKDGYQDTGFEAPL